MSNNNMTTEQMMTMLRPEIKNKIMRYALKCPHNLEEIQGGRFLCARWWVALDEIKVGDGVWEALPVDQKKCMFDRTLFYNKEEISNDYTKPRIDKTQVIISESKWDTVIEKMRAVRVHGDYDMKNIWRTTRMNVVQTLWEFRGGDITLKELKDMAKVNKIKGRSKLKTRRDYVRAFMAL